MKITDAVSNIWESVNLQAVYYNKVDSSFKKTLQFSIYSKNDQVPTVTSKIWKLEPFVCLYKFANNKINRQKKNRKDLYKAGIYSIFFPKESDKSADAAGRQQGVCGSSRGRHGSVSRSEAAPRRSRAERRALGDRQFGRTQGGRAEVLSY